MSLVTRFVIVPLDEQEDANPAVSRVTSYLDEEFGSVICQDCPDGDTPATTLIQMETAIDPQVTPFSFFGCDTHGPEMLVSMLVPQVGCCG